MTRLTRDRFVWSLLLAWMGVLSVAMILATDAAVWAVALVLLFWTYVFVRLWPDDEEPSE